MFAMQGFEQATQMREQARNPQRDISRAVIIAMVSGTLLYIALEIAFIGTCPTRWVGRGRRSRSLLRSAGAACRSGRSSSPSFSVSWPSCSRAGFSLAIFYWAITLCADSECVNQAVSAEADEIRSSPELSVE